MSRNLFESVARELLAELELLAEESDESERNEQDDIKEELSKEKDVWMYGLAGIIIMIVAMCVWIVLK